MANSYLKTGRLSHEKRDCSVIALAYAWGMEYIKAHELCKKAGRKDCQGFNLFHDLFNVGPRRKYKQFKNRGVSYHKRPGMSVKKFRDTHMTGIYVIHVSGHVFTMIDGRILNQSSLLMHVDEYCYISADFNAPKPDTFIKILRMAKIECDKGTRLVFTVVRNGIEYTLELGADRYPGLYDNPVAATAVINRIPDIENLLVLVDAVEEEESLSDLLNKVMETKEKNIVDSAPSFPGCPQQILDVCKDEGYTIMGEDNIDIVKNKALFTTVQFHNLSWVYVFRGEYGYPGWVAFYEKILHKKDKKEPTKVYRIRKLTHKTVNHAK